MDKAKLTSVSMSVQFENFKPINNSGFVRGICKVAYAGKNRNYSNIPKESFEKAEPTVFGIPVVGNWLGDNFGGHDILLETKGNEVSVKDNTTPFGFVPQDANPRWETVEDENGNSKNYYVVDVILWQERYPEPVQFVIDNGANQSMEIMVTEGDWDNNWEYFDINNFYYSALCLLGREVDEKGNKGLGDVEPCFEQSEIVINKFNMTEKFKKDLFAIKEAFKGGGNLDKTENTEVITEEFEEEVVEVEIEADEEFTEEVEVKVESETIEEFNQEEDLEEVATYELEFKELTSKYETLEVKYNELLEVNKSLQEYKDEKESEILAAQKDEVIKEYSLLLDKEDISAIDEEKDSFSLDELKIKLAKVFAERELEKAKLKAEKAKTDETIIFDNKQKDNKTKKNKFAI